MTKRSIPLAALAVVLLVATPVPARADWILTPFLGLSFGGDTTKDHMTYGGNLSFRGSGLIGFELDGAWTPDGLDDVDTEIVSSDSSVRSLMVNLVLGPRVGSSGVSPYVSGGIGLLGFRRESPFDVSDLDEDALGGNVGGGLMLMAGSRVGLRADIRYFKRLRGDDSDSPALRNFTFWRGTVGLSLRF